MISVSREDWGDRSVLGSEMEEVELEEGEALNHHTGNEDSAVDPDINSLSYIEEKLQSVLGHFQKDFEGGVSAENLGAKFGGYGSFLPTYQRSPEVVHNPQKSPKKERKPDPSASVSSSPPAKSNIASGKAASKGKGKLQSRHADKLTTKSGSNDKPINSLKLRIKVGSENLLTQKNVDIYNGLGLVSPSSSLDGSPETSEWQNHKAMPDESPTSILKTMTSFPVDVLLSPLSEDLIHLNRRHRGKHEKRSTARTSMSAEKSFVLINGFHSSRSNEKAPEAKRLKFSASELADPMNSRGEKNALPLRKECETDDDALLCEDIVSNALRLPLLSTSIPARDTGRLGNLGSSLVSSSNLSENDKHKSSSINAAGPAVVSQMTEASNLLDQTDFSGSKSKKIRSATESSDMSKQLAFHNGGSVRAEDVKSSLELSTNSDNKKLKIIQSAGSQGACSRKDESAVGLSVAYKHEKLVDARFGDSKNDLHDPKKENEKPANRYKDFFGEEEFDDDDEDDTESLNGELTSAGRSKDHHLSVKSSFNKDQSMPNERSTIKSTGNPQSKEKYSRIGSHPANSVFNGSSTDAPSGLKPMVNEYWVSCDLCHIWRLLPLGTDPNSLPDKWTCSMLTWLPGMDRCYIPEEYTTNALRSLYQPAVAVPAPISEVKQMEIAAGYQDQEHPSIVVKPTVSTGKKKYGSTKATNSTELDGSTRSSSSKKKTLITTGKGSTLSGGNSSTSTDGGKYQLSGRSSFGTEKVENAKRKMSVVSCPERGTQISVKSKQEFDAEGSKASKRDRSEERHFDGEKMIANNVGSSLKGSNASTSFSNSTSENERRKSRNRVSALDNKNPVSDIQAETYPPGSANNASVHSRKHDEKESLRKRKSKEHHDPETHSEKRVRALKSTKISNMETDRKSEGPRHEHHAVYLDSNQASDYLKSDMGPLQPSVAANSSSSKVSGSRKSKMDGQEVKGSPVESVSSSPQRYHDADKVSSAVKDLVGKFDVEDCRALTAVSPRRPLSDGVPNGQAEMKKSETLASTSNISGFNGHIGQNGKFPGAKNPSDHCSVDGNTNTGQCQDTGFHMKKSGKHSKAVSQASVRDLERVSNRDFDSSHDSLDHRQSYEDKMKSRRNKLDDKSGTTIRSEGRTPNENAKAQGRISIDVGQDATKSLDKSHDIREQDIEKSSHGNVKSHSLPPLARINTETAANHEPVSGYQKDKGVNISADDAFDGGDIQKVQVQKMKAENLNAPPVRLSTPNSHKVRDANGSSPVRRESSSHAANSIVKEATDLKHKADRMKNLGSLESVSLYIEACLKFLHGASLMELTGREANKHNELMNSMNIYSSTAKLCEYCAHEYEKSKDMAAAALAYKCMEVAHMRVVYSNNPSASRDRNELQSALQIAAPGESPSSSASDVDNLNHQNGAPEKGALAKVGGSPHVSGSHVISSRNRASFIRLLNFAQDVNFAMEASKRSRLAFTAAIQKFSETSNEEAVSSLRKALDYTFHDLDGFLRLVRLAMEALNS